jgi:hypothetical protein
MVCKTKNAYAIAGHKRLRGEYSFATQVDDTRLSLVFPPFEILEEKYGQLDFESLFPG